MEVTIYGFTMNIAIIWIIVAVIFALIEAATVGLATIWFVVGALVAAIAALLGAGLLVQIGIFLAVSILLLVFTRPIVKRRMEVGKERTNVDALIGKSAKVTKEIRRMEDGEAKVNGLTWIAVAADANQCFSVGSEVSIARVEGTKLIVESLNLK